jgi:hypothetical protein
MVSFTIIVKQKCIIVLTENGIFYLLTKATCTVIILVTFIGLERLNRKDIEEGQSFK